MTETRALSVERDRARERRRIAGYTLATWWYSRGPWTHITVLTVLWLGLCVSTAVAVYPWLERAVTS